MSLANTNVNMEGEYLTIQAMGHTKSTHMHTVVTCCLLPGYRQWNAVLLQAGYVFIPTHLALNGFGDIHFAAVPHHSVTKLSCVAGIIYTCEHIELCECVCVRRGC